MSLLSRPKQSSSRTVQTHYGGGASGTSWVAHTRRTPSSHAPIPRCRRGIVTDIPFLRELHDASFPVRYPKSWYREIFQKSNEYRIYLLVIPQRRRQQRQEQRRILQQGQDGTTIFQMNAVNAGVGAGVASARASAAPEVLVGGAVIRISTQTNLLGVPQHDQVYLATFAVDKRARGKGYGVLLLDYLLNDIFTVPNNRFHVIDEALYGECRSAAAAAAEHARLGGVGGRNDTFVAGSRGNRTSSSNVDENTSSSSSSSSWAPLSPLRNPTDSDFIDDSDDDDNDDDDDDDDDDSAKEEDGEGEVVSPERIRTHITREKNPESEAKRPLHSAAITSSSSSSSFSSSPSSLSSSPVLQAILASSIDLHCLADNAAAIGLYEKVGMHITSHLPRYYTLLDVPHDAVHMQMTRKEWLQRRLQRVQEVKKNHVSAPSSATLSSTSSSSSTPLHTTGPSGPPGSHPHSSSSSTKRGTGRQGGDGDGGDDDDDDDGDGDGDDAEEAWLISVLKALEKEEAASSGKACLPSCAIS